MKKPNPRAIPDLLMSAAALLYYSFGWNSGNFLFDMLPFILSAALVVKASAYLFFIRFDFRNLLVGMWCGALLWGLLAGIATVSWYVSGHPTLRSTAGMVVFDLCAALNAILLAKLLRKKRETDNSTEVAEAEK